MGNKLHERIEVWKKQLLDLGKRNKLINFLESKRANVKITAPYFDTLWNRIVVEEHELRFPYAINPQVDENGNEKCDKVIEGDLQTNKTYGELQKTLKALRNRANQAIEELGVNILYLTFGMLKWKEREDSTQEICSPLILVPVRLLIESLTSPYRLALHEDEIIVNPTLAHKLNNDFGIVLPDFDSVQSSPNEYFNEIASIVEKNNWAVERCVYLAQLSFLKINMYKDLEKNEDRLVSNPIILALAGESILEQDTDVFKDIDYDNQTRPIDIFQVVDADSSQQDAIMCSKKGLSFVLQGPPGTGKSQTITNIIAEAIADGKKVLFVSEKMAALQVVYKRLEEVGLADFCLTLHNHKANKKDILRELENSTYMDKTRVREEVMARLDMLENKRKLLNDYQEELHTSTSELDISIFQAYGKLAKMENVPDVVFQISDVDKVTKKVLNERTYLLDELSKTVDDKNEENVWRDTAISSLTSALTHKIDAYITEAHPLVEKLAEQLSAVCEKLGISFSPTLKGADELISFLDFVAKSPFIPSEWLIENDLST